jgi:tetratricopeptide (TPR) repeat protein
MGPEEGQVEARAPGASPAEPGGDMPGPPADPPEAFADLFERGLALLDAELAAAARGRAPAGAAGALALLERAFALRPDDPDVLYALGLAHGARALGALRSREDELAFPDRTELEASLQKAIFAYSRASELDPGCVEALNNLAALHALRGDRDLAIEALKRSLKARPDQPDVRERLEELGAF